MSPLRVVRVLESDNFLERLLLIIWLALSTFERMIGSGQLFFAGSKTFSVSFFPLTGLMAVR